MFTDDEIDQQENDAAWQLELDALQRRGGSLSDLMDAAGGDLETALEILLCS